MSQGNALRGRMPIRGIREYADLVRAGEDTTEVRMRRLTEHREAVSSDLAEQQRYLDAITQKIDAYRRMLAEKQIAEKQRQIRIRPRVMLDRSRVRLLRDSW